MAKLHHPILVAVLATLSAWAFYTTWGLSLLDGTLYQIIDTRAADVPRLPGGDAAPLQLRFTNIPAADYWLTIMVLFFWQAVDGSHPATSLTGIYFLGQLVGIWTLVFVEGQRVGSAGRLIARTLMWTLLMQNLTLGCFGPIYFAIHLETATAPSGELAASSSRLGKAAQQLKYLPAAVIIGFVLPSIWIGLPVSSQQVAIAVWTPFPVWVGLAQAGLSWLDPRMATDGATAYRCALRRAYAFAVVGSAVVHISIVAVSLSTLLFPAIFAPSVLAEFSPVNILLPKNAAAHSIGAGVLNFMQWDQWIGYTALGLWAWKLVRDDKPSWNGTASFILSASTAVAILGPGGAAALLLWKRDESRWAAQKRLVKQ